MSARRTRAVVCDFGGVLTTPLIQAFVAYQDSLGIGMESLGEAMARATEAAGGKHPLFELERGAISEADFLRQIEAQLGGDVRLDGFRDVYFHHLHPNPEMIAYVRDLRRRGIRTALLTNNVREWEPLWRAKLPEIDEIFEVVVDSAFVGMRKPEHEIYHLTVKRLGNGLRPEDCVFVDDIEVNCDTAAELGMVAVHYREPEQAIAELRRAVDGSAPAG